MTQFCKDPVYLKVNELFSIENDIKKQEEEFVKRFIEKTKLDLFDEDQIYVIPSHEFLYLISIIIREYETLRLSPPLINQIR